MHDFIYLVEGDFDKTHFGGFSFLFSSIATKKSLACTIPLAFFLLIIMRPNNRFEHASCHVRSNGIYF